MMISVHLLFSGDYFVIGVDKEQYDADDPTKFLKDLLKEENDLVAERGYRNYLGILPSASVGIQNFTIAVNEYMERPPFNFPNPLNKQGGVKTVSLNINIFYIVYFLYILFHIQGV